MPNGAAATRNLPFERLPAAVDNVARSPSSAPNGAGAAHGERRVSQQQGGCGDNHQQERHKWDGERGSAKPLFFIFTCPVRGPKPMLSSSARGRRTRRVCARDTTFNEWMNSDFRPMACQGGEDPYLAGREQRTKEREERKKKDKIRRDGKVKAIHKRKYSLSEAELIA